MHLSGSGPNTNSICRLPMTIGRSFLSNSGSAIPAPWSAAVSNGGVIHGNLKAISTLVLIIVLSMVLVFITLLVPSVPSIRQVEPQIALVGSTYFLLIGL